MKQLSGTDNLFLEMETGNQYMHVGSLGIYDSTTAPGGSLRFKDILSYFSRRLPLAKVFRRRLVVTPLGLDRPHWIEDGEVDIEYHVRHIALPKPGDWRQLMIQVARIHSRPLDRSKPLWEAYVIEGLDNIPGVVPGSFAFYIKFHHAAVDGEAGAAILGAIHSLTADADAVPVSQDTMVRDRIPGAIELYSRAVSNRTRQVFDASRLIMTLGSRAALVGKDMLMSGKAIAMGKQLVAKQLGGKKSSDVGTQGDSAGIKPMTRFDADISAHRVVDAVGFSLAHCKTIRQHVADVTLNDIFMAASGGALRKYLELKGELPAKTLNASVPMSSRGANKDMDAGNQIGMAAMPLRTDIADPLERLLAVHRGTTKGKAASASMGRDLPGKLVNVLPASAAMALSKNTLYRVANVTVSNVRGPDVPLFLAGARLQLFLPVSLPTNGMGLNITGFSYTGTLWVCFVACRDMLPDPAEMVRCFNESFEELLAAAIAQPLHTQVKPSSSAKAQTAPRKPATRKTLAKTVVKSTTDSVKKGVARAR